MTPIHIAANTTGKAIQVGLEPVAIAGAARPRHHWWCGGLKAEVARLFQVHEDKYGSP